MGEVLEITRTTCPCGWKPPRKVALLFEAKDLAALKLAGAKEADFEYRCPECDRKHVCTLVM